MLIRVDDFPHGGSEAPDKWDMLSHFMDNMNLPILLGVVPMAVNKDDILKIKAEYPLIEIAQHGVSHKRFENFQHVPVFGDNYPRVYIPPHNYINIKIYDAVISSGMTAMTSGPETDPVFLEMPHVIKSMWYDRIGKLFNENFSTAGRYDCLTLHLTWEYPTGGDTIMEFSEKIKSYVISWKEYNG